jgi:hypothetical protein
MTLGMRRWRLAWATLALTVAFLVPPSQAAAGSPPLTAGFADQLFGSPNAQVRSTWLDRAVGAGAGIVRVGVSWSQVAPAKPPPGFDGADPSSPAYSWTRLDATVRDAAARGLRIMFTVSRAPRWAEGPDRPAVAQAGSWKPDPAALGDFAWAVAIRYSGRFPDPAAPGVPLPRVRLFEVWNEPNLEYFLGPQRQGNALFGPGWYRKMLNRFYAAVKSVQPGAKIIGPGTAPFGYPREPFGDRRTQPVLFLRSLLCLKGGRLKPTACPSRAHFDVLSHHPISTAREGPTAPAHSPLNASTADISKLTRVLRKAEKSRRVLPRRHRRPVWATEMWWDSNPPDPHGYPLAVQARWMELAEYMLWKQGVSTAIFLPMVDTPLGRDSSVTLQSGIFFIDGRPKPSYRAFKFPFVTRRINPTTIVAWGNAPARGRVRIQRRAKRGWVTVRRLKAVHGQPFEASLRSVRTARFRAVSRAATSLTWRQPAARAAKPAAS